MAVNVSSRQKRRPIQKKIVNDSAFYEDDAEEYSSATESVIGASESNSGQSNILPHNSLQNDCIAEVVDSDMNHSDTELFKVNLLTKGLKFLFQDLKKIFLLKEMYR